jgi:hypothetical protein
LAGKITAESFTQRWGNYLNPKVSYGARRHGVLMQQFTPMLAGSGISRGIDDVRRARKVPQLNQPDRAV